MPGWVAVSGCLGILRCDKRRASHGWRGSTQGTDTVEPQLQRVIQHIHDSSLQAALVVSGGGSQALAWLLAVPGATRTVLETTLPYSYVAFERFLGYRPDQFVSRATAINLAKTAYRRARLLAAEGTPSIGLACTATLVTDRPKRGQHRCEVAVRDEGGTTTYSLVLNKGGRDRAGEEAVVSLLILHALAEASGVANDLDLDLLEGEQIKTGRLPEPDLILEVLRGELPAVRVDINRQVDTVQPDGVVILPGAFNPLHGGHLQLAHVAAQMAEREAYFELSVHNVDKPPLLEADVRQRLDQFFGRGALLLTTAPLFEQKARLFPNSVFVVGFDTATRLVGPQYYGDDEAQMRASLRHIRERGGSFLVAGRLYEDHFRTLADVKDSGRIRGHVHAHSAGVVPRRHFFHRTAQPLRRLGGVGVE